MNKTRTFIKILAWILNFPYGISGKKILKWNKINMYGSVNGVERYTELSIGVVRFVKIVPCLGIILTENKMLMVG